MIDKIFPMYKKCNFIKVTACTHLIFRNGKRLERLIALWRDHATLTAALFTRPLRVADPSSALVRTGARVLVVARVADVGPVDGVVNEALLVAVDREALDAADEVVRRQLARPLQERSLVAQTAEQHRVVVEHESAGMRTSVQGSKVQKDKSWNKIT